MFTKFYRGYKIEALVIREDLNSGGPGLLRNQNGSKDKMKKKAGMHGVNPEYDMGTPFPNQVRRFDSVRDWQQSAFAPWKYITCRMTERGLTKCT